MEAVPSPVPGSALDTSPVSLGDVSSWRAGVLRCLHFLTCRICDPPPEVPDTLRLAIAILMYGASAALLAWVLSSQVVSVVYCALGLARLFPRRSKSLALVGGLAALAWLSLLWLPGPWPAALAAVSELCWLMTLRRVLDEEFDVFVAVLFLFVGVELTFGFFPLLMHWGPEFVQSPEVHETVQRVVSHAVQAGQHANSSPGPPAAPGGRAVEESSHLNPTDVLIKALPLLALLVGVPGLAFAALVSCWLFEHMSRMVLAVAVSFVSWMALYAILATLHFPVSHDLFGKAILASACVLMYHAFSRLTCIDGRAAQARLMWLGGAFAAIFAVDRLVVFVGGQSPFLLFAVLVACKLTYSTWANFLEAEGQGPLLQAKHLSPFRASAPGGSVGGGAEERDRGRSPEGGGEGMDEPLRANYI